MGMCRDEFASYVVLVLVSLAQLCVSFVEIIIIYIIFPLIAM